jgi:hypothetical protein
MTGCGCKSQHDRMWMQVTTQHDVDVSQNNMTGCGCKSQQHDRMWMQVTTTRQDVDVKST